MTTASLAVLLLAAQALVLQHDADEHAYEADHVCAVCISASVLGGAHVPAAAPIDVLPSGRLIGSRDGGVFLSGTTRHNLARAPPATA